MTSSLKNAKDVLDILIHSRRSYEQKELESKAGLNSSQLRDVLDFLIKLSFTQIHKEETADKKYGELILIDLSPEFKKFLEKQNDFELQRRVLITKMKSNL